MDEILAKTCVLVLTDEYPSRVRKLEPLADESWNIYLLVDGDWQFYDSVGKESAIELVSDAVEIFCEISLPSRG